MHVQYYWPIQAYQNYRGRLIRKYNTMLGYNVKCLWKNACQILISVSGSTMCTLWYRHMVPGVKGLLEGSVTMNKGYISLILIRIM